MRPIVFLLLLSFACSACVDEISLEVPPGEEAKLAIEGRLSKGDPSTAYVVLSRTSDFSEDALPEKINGASVAIYNQAGDNLALPNTGNGRYETIIDATTGFEVTVGQAYRLEVVTPDGQQYTSTAEVLYEVPKADSLEYAVITKMLVNAAGNLVGEEFLAFSVHTPTTTAGNDVSTSLRWDITGCFQLREIPASGPGIPADKTCYVKQNLNIEEVLLFDGSSSDGAPLRAFPLFEERIDHRFATGYYLTVLQRSLSPGALEYWSQVGELVIRNGGLFEPPPGPVVSNLQNVNDPAERVLGYFAAEAVDTVRVAVKLPSDVRPFALCELQEAPDFSFCRNCLEWPGSFLEKPAYWID